MLRIEGSEYFGRMVDGDILKLYVKGTVEETHQKYATDAVVELLRPTLEVEVRSRNILCEVFIKLGREQKRGISTFIQNFFRCDGIQDSLGFWIRRCGFRILFQWKLDSGLQSLVGFQIAKCWILDCTGKNSKKLLESVFQKQKFPGIRFPLHQATHYRKIPKKKPPCISPPKFPPWKFAHKYKVTDKAKTVNFLRTIRLAQSIFKLKCPSID